MVVHCENGILICLMILKSQRLLLSNFGVGGAGYDFEGSWRDKGLFAYHTGKYAGYAYFGSGGTEEEELEQMGGDDKYRIWEVNDPNMPKEVREKWRKIEPILARSYYLYPPK